MHWTPLTGAKFEDVFGPQGKSDRSGCRNRLRRDDKRAKAKPSLESLESRVTPAAPTVSIVSSSLASTTDNSATIGEIVRFRVRANEQLTGNYTPGQFNIHATLPAGLQLLPGSATIALVSDQGMTSTLGAGANVTGNNANVDTITPTFMLPAGSITTDPATGAVIFNAGISNVADNDASNEYVIIEFDALVTNVAGNQTPTQLDSSFLVYINGQTCGCIGNASVQVVEPTITDMAKTATVNAAGDTVTYTLTFTNSGNSTAYDVRVVDNLPAGLTFAGVGVTATGGSGLTDRSNATTVDVTFDSVAAGGSVRIEYQATIPAAMRNGQTITNTGNVTYTSLPGANGTAPTAPGAAGSATGERTGSGGVNDYNDSAQASIQVQTQGADDCVEISGLVYLDKNCNGKKDLGDSGIAGVTIQLLDANGNPILRNGNAVTTTTDVNGFWQFTGLAPGTYRVREVQPAGFADGADVPGQVGGVNRGSNPSNDILQVTLGPDESGVKYNFFECPANTQLSGFVIFDKDCNGIKNANDTGIAGVTIQLLDANGNPILVNGTAVTTTTDVNGFWQFTGLAPGTYRVREVQPAGFADGADVPGQVGGVTRGSSPANDVLQVNLANGESGEKYNFFECPATTSLSGFVIFDKDCDGIKDQNETGIAGVTIELLDGAGNPILVNGTAVTTTTDVNGFWQFTGLAAGTYRAREVQPAGFADGADVPGQVGGVNRGSSPANDVLEVNLAAGDAGVKYNFFECPATTSLSGFVVFDKDCDGIKDADETGIAGVTIQLLDAAGNPVLVNGTAVTTTTDANGFWQFTNLAPGTYRAREVQPAGFLDGVDVPGQVGGTARGSSPANDVLEVALAGGEAGVNYNFFECPLTTSLSGFVVFDRDCDGIKDVGETGIAGVTIQLLDAAGNPVLVNGTAVTTTTNADGFWEFTNLAAGTYRAREVQPAGFLDGVEVPGQVGGTNRGSTPANDVLEVALAGGEAGVNYNFFECPATTQLSGFVVFDRDCDGVRDVGETGIAGVTIQLLDAAGNPVLVNGTAVTTTTNADGFWEFTNLAAGTYRAREVQPAGFLDGVEVPGQVGGTNRGSSPANDVLEVALAAGEAGVNYNFFECPLPTQISGFVVFDRDCDGIKDVGETGIAGVTIQLLDGAGNPILVGGVPVVTTTNADGFYQFLNLPAGTYQVRQVQPAGFLDGLEVPGQVNGTNRGTVVTNDVLQVALDAGEAGVNYNFFECPLFAQISGFVFLDVDCDGLKEAGDTGLAGVSVQLTDLAGNPVLDINGNPVGTVVTDANGFYQFLNLPAGTYRVTELPPQPTFNGGPTIDGLDTPGTVNGVTRGSSLNDIITGVNLAAGDSSINNNFGECQANLAAISLSGHVYFDTDRSLVRTGPDLPIGGARLLLFRTDLPGLPTLVAEAFTNERGEYNFNIETPGSYRVVLAPNERIRDLIRVAANVGRIGGTPRGLAAALDLLDAITLNDGDAGTDYDFGLFSGVTPPPFSKQQLLANTPGGGGGAGGGAGGVGGTQAFASDPSFANINRNAPGTRILAVGTDAGGGPHVRVFNFTTGQALFSFYAYDAGFTGGVRVATGDVTGDGVPDVITAPGVGGGPHIKIFNGATGALVREFFAYDRSFTSGVYVAAGDVTGDGIADIITGAGQGGGPHVKVFDGATGAMIREFFAYDSSFQGGVRLSAGDFNNDGRADIVTGAGPGGGPHVRVFNGATGAVISEFFAFEQSFTGGVNVTSNRTGAGDVTGDGRADIVVGTGSGAARVRVFSGTTFELFSDYTAFDPSLSRNGARVGLFDLNGDGRADVVVGAGGDLGTFVRVTDLRTGQDLEFFQSFNPAFTGGVFLSAS